MASPSQTFARRSAGVWPSSETARQTLSELIRGRRSCNPRLPNYLSPSRFLALRLRSRNKEQRVRYSPAFMLSARMKHERLPLLTVQALLRRNTFPGEEHLLEALGSSSSPEWKDRLSSLASRGWSEEDLDDWISILSAEDGDTRVQRFLSTERPKPIFMLLLLLRSDENFKRAESLISLMDVLSKQYLNPNFARLSDQYGTAALRQQLLVGQFLIFLRRLVHHVQRLWPQSIVTVARLTADYIRAISIDHKYPRRRRLGYTNRCLVFNTALRLFARPASHQPLVNMEFNWRAQRILLAMSDNLERRLKIDKLAFRAIRKVMIGLKRSGAERAVAMRYAKTWPPYRQDFDGLDAKRTPEDDHSRSVKAGVLMKQEGYSEDDYDRALDNLGGTSAESPTIQTRSSPPKEWKDDKEQWNFFNRWAMRIRATRNINEAWRAFTRFSDAEPNFQVYNEMFLKLQAREMDPDTEILPGDARETYPVHRANYSEYELARQSPPTVAELYDHMISRGTKPEGNCLVTLVRNARTVENGVQYLRDSSINPESVDALAMLEEPPHKLLRRIPLGIFNSYIQLLCRLQPTRRGRLRFRPDELYRIRRAIELIKQRLVPETTEGVTYRPPWHAVLRALARHNVCLTNDEQVYNDAEALSLSTALLEDARKTVGLDPEIFLYYCHTVQKSAVSQLDLLNRAVDTLYTTQYTATTTPWEQPPLLADRDEILRLLRELFDTLTAPIKQEGGLEVPPLLHNIGPAHLHAYMRALAFLEDTDAMVDAMHWMLENQGCVDNEADQLQYRGRSLIAKTLCAFRTFAGPCLTAEQSAELDAGMARATAEGGGGVDGAGWCWPTPDEVEHYVSADLRGGSRKLQQRCIARWWQMQQQQNWQQQQQQQQRQRQTQNQNQNPAYS